MEMVVALASEYFSKRVSASEHFLRCVFCPKKGRMEVIDQPIIDSLQATRPLYVPLVAGGVAGLFTDVALFPLDTVKTRLQGGTGRFNMKGLYNGLGPAALAAAPSAAIFFGTYEYMKRKVGHDGVMNQGGAAAVAEVASCLFKVPFEVVKQRLQASVTSSVESSSSVLRSIIKSEGVRGCYSGFSATVLREIPFGFIQMPVYEFLKRKVVSSRNSPLSGIEACLCGAIAGGVAAAVTCPIDVWKTRLMLGNRKTSIISIAKTEGIGSLFSGIVPRVVWISVGGSMFFGVYELVTQFISS